MSNAGTLHGRVAVVTGGSRGIGAAIAGTLAAQGCAVGFTYRTHEPEARALESAILAAGRTGVDRRLRCGRRCCGRQIHGGCHEALGPIDILVNNAGVVRDAHIALLDAAKWDAVVDVNLRAAYVAVRAVVRGMLLRRWGRDYQHLLAERTHAEAGPDRLRGVEGGPRGIHAWTLARPRAQGWYS